MVFIGHTVRKVPYLEVNPMGQSAASAPYTTLLDGPEGPITSVLRSVLRKYPHHGCAILLTP